MPNKELDRKTDLIKRKHQTDIKSKNKHVRSYARANVRPEVYQNTTLADDYATGVPKGFRVLR